MIMLRNLIRSSEVQKFSGKPVGGIIHYYLHNAFSESLVLQL